MTDLLHASITTSSLDSTRHHLADAPDWARASIDQEREKRGLPTLFARAATPASPAKAARTIIGFAAPGLSLPHRIDSKRHEDRELLPEFITRAAWAGVAADVEAGVPFAFQTGHNGKPWLRSDDPSVELEFDDVAGLIFRIGGEAADKLDYRCDGFASIGFIPRRWETHSVRGKWVRQITAMTLKHIAFLPPHHERPAYRLARVVSVPPDQAIRTLVRARCDVRLAVKEAMGL